MSYISLSQPGLLSFLKLKIVFIHYLLFSDEKTSCPKLKEMDWTKKKNPWKLKKKKGGG